MASSRSVDLISDKPNRWNAKGEPTIYLSGDPALALIEAGRHPEDLEDRALLFEVDVLIPLAVDIRDRAVRAALGLPDDVTWVLDRERTQAAARSLRHSGMCDALLVPSAGALDQEERFNLVVFADDRARIPRLVANLQKAGELVMRAARLELA
jgi:RES domain-containing protein